MDRFSGGYGWNLIFIWLQAQLMAYTVNNKQHLQIFWISSDILKLRYIFQRIRKVNYAP